MSDTQTTLGAISNLVSEKIQVSELDFDTYISTENMLPNLGGVDIASSLPSAEKTRLFKSGDILFSNIRTYFKKVWYANFDGGCSNDIIVFRGYKNVDSRFLYYVLADDYFIDYTVKTSKGTKMPRGDKDAIKQYSLKLPPLPEQKAIAHMLGKLDDKIELNRQMNQTLEEMAQALFKSWFVDFDPVLDNAMAAGIKIPEALQAMAEKRTLVPDHLKLNTKNSALSKLFPSSFEYNETLGKWIPEGWEVKSLDEIANYQNGLALQKFRPENEEDDFLPVLKISHLKEGKTDGKEKARIDIKPECRVDDGDVIFSWSASLLVDIWCGGKAALNQHLFKVTSNKFPKWFFYLFTKHHLDEFIRIAADKAVTMGHIKREHLSEAKCAFMEKSVMDNISKQFESLINKQIENRLEIETLTQLRDTLLPQLISGKVRVPEGFVEKMGKQTLES